MKLLPNFSKLQPTSGELLHLDLLRFVASVGIVIHHSMEFFVSIVERPVLNAQTMGLALFVDLFFVISRFVIAYVYNDRVSTKAGYFTFLQRRIGRLVPLHWFTLVITVGIWALFVFVFNIRANHIPSFRPECILDTALLAHSFLPCGNNQYFNGVSWSISAEMVMYIAFPLVAFIGRKNKWFLLGSAVAALMFAVADMLDNQHTSSLFEWTDMAPVTRAAPSFLFGAALFYGRSIVRNIQIPGTILAVCVPLLVTIMVFGAPQILGLLIVYVVVTAAVAADLRGTTSSMVRRFAPLGQMTYSIYMWHPLIILLVMNAIGDKVLHANMAETIILAAVCYAAIAIVSYCSFFLIESPARRAIDAIRLVKYGR